MREGLLWYDDDPGRDLAAKIARAVARFKRKYDLSATICYVHPSVVDKRCKLGTIEVAPLPTILLHHFYICHEKEV